MMRSSGEASAASPPRQPDKATKYQANTFTINCLDQWQDKTIYILAGPVTDGLQHNVTITVGQDVPFSSAREFAEWQIGTTQQELKGCRLLKKGAITLASGTPAYHAIFSWIPTDGLKVYQEQIFVLSEGRAYTLTATFSKKSRKTLGPQVERMMLSFEPLKPRATTQGASR
jgi:hypothetical protein